MFCGMEAVWVVLMVVGVAECRHIGADASKSCMFGNKTVADGDVAMNVPEKCVMMLCREGEIVEKMIGALGDTGCCVDGKDNMYPPGFKPSQCMTSTCTNGTWVSDGIIDPCCGRCELYSYSHFTTSDTHRYDWHGFCNYTLLSLNAAGDKNYTSAAVFTEMSRVGSCGTLFGHTTFRNDRHTVINITRNSDNSVSQQIDVNGDTMTIPRNGTHCVKSSAGNHNVVVYWQEDCLNVQGDSGVSLRFCPFRLDIWTPRHLASSVNGLCGLFNHNNIDDFTSPAGQLFPLETFPVEYPDMHWRAPDQVMAECTDPMTTSVCNGTTGNKCLLPPSTMEEFHRACSDFLRQLYPDQPTLVQYYVPPCVTDLCLVAQRGIDYSSTPSDFVAEVLKNYKNITKRHYEDLKITPPLMDKRMCALSETTTAIHVDDDSTHATNP